MNSLVPATVLMGLLALGPCTESDPAAPDEQDSAIAEFTTLVNAARSNAGCPSLTWNAEVAGVAARHSQDMRDRNFFSHDNPDGQSPFDRLNRARITYRAAAENILMGTRSGQRAFEMWMDSPGHRANLLNCVYAEHGVGTTETYWTHVFIAPRR
jgi:uncharacterized protein YkwD